jgi:hypothetical protein
VKTIDKHLERFLTKDQAYRNPDYKLKDRFVLSQRLSLSSLSPICSLIQMAVAIRQDDDEQILLRQQEEDLRLKKLSKIKKPTFSSKLTESEMQVHQTNQPSTPGTPLLLFPNINGSKAQKEEQSQQMNSKRLKKLIKVCLRPSRSFPLTLHLSLSLTHTHSLSLSTTEK